MELKQKLKRFNGCIPLWQLEIKGQKTYLVMKLV